MIRLSFISVYGAHCSKTYSCIGDYNKTITKGLTKQHNTLDKDSLMTVLTQQAGGGEKMGFKLQGSFVYKYKQQRNSIIFLH